MSCSRTIHITSFDSGTSEPSISSLAFSLLSDRATVLALHDDIRNQGKNLGYTCRSHLNSSSFVLKQVNDHTK